MLLSVTISNFKSVKEPQTVSFEAVKDKNLSPDQVVPIDDHLRLLKVATVIGPNGVGKSVVVRALEVIKSLIFAHDSTVNPLAGFAGSAFAFDPETQKQPSTIVIQVVLGRDAATSHPNIYTYTISADMEKIYYESVYIQVGKSSRRMYERILEEEQEDATLVYRFRWGKKYLGQKKKLGKRVPANRTFLTAAVDAGSESLKPLFNWFQNNLSIMPMGLSSLSEKKISEVLQAHPDWLPQLIDFLWCMDIIDVKDIRISEKDGRLIYIHGNNNGHYASYFSSESLGVRRLTLMGIMMMEAFVSEKCLVADDFTILLHPHLVKHVLETFASSNKFNKSQLLAVGVDTTLLDGELIRHDGIWFTTKNVRGETIYYSLADYKKLSRKDLLIQYNHGSFGAVPIISDVIFRLQKEGLTL